HLDQRLLMSWHLPAPSRRCVPAAGVFATHRFLQEDNIEEGSHRSPASLSVLRRRDNEVTRPLRQDHLQLHNEANYGDSGQNRVSRLVDRSPYHVSGGVRLPSIAMRERG